MKKQALVILGLIFSISLFGQDYKTTIGLKLYPSFSTSYEAAFLNKNTSRFNFSGGLEIRQSLFKDLIYLETGISFFDRGFKVDLNFVDLNSNTEDSEIAKEVHSYLLLPLSMVFKFNRFYGGVGINLNYFLQRKYFLNDQLESSERLFSQKDFIFGGQVFAGYEFSIKENILISVEGFLNPTTSVRYLNYGLGIGLKYALR